MRIRWIANEVMVWTVFWIALVVILASYGRADEFADSLNAIRATNGQRPVAVDAALAGHSATNNAQQRQRGLGHFWTGGFAQCAAIGCGTLRDALSMWSASPAHAAILYSPNLVSVGAHCDGWAATVTCQMGQQTTTASIGPGGGIPSASNAIRGRRGFHPFRRWCR